MATEAESPERDISFALEEVTEIPKRPATGGATSIVDKMAGSIATVRENPGKTYRIALYGIQASAARTVTRLRQACPDLYVAQRKLRDGEHAGKFGVFAQVKAKGDDNGTTTPAKSAAKKAAPAKKAAGK